MSRGCHSSKLRGMKIALRLASLAQGRVASILVVLAVLSAASGRPHAQSGAPAGRSVPGGVESGSDRLAALKAEAVRDVESRFDATQQMIDMVFSFGELGYQEVETSKFLTGVLRQNGFTIQDNVAGMPTAWVARWGSGRPVIALGSDIDGIPQASQKPGVAYHEPLIEGAPGHGEGHNSGMPLQITAALAVKKIMEREKLPGTLVLWPGVAEELLGGKAYLVRAGVFKDVDVAIFAHVANMFRTSWGSPDSSTGLVSVEYRFQGSTAHAGSQPWTGRSALDAVELMDIAWNFRREHLRLSQRSHYVITNGGDQPNVVPSQAAVWYYLRETDYPHIKELRQLADRLANAAAMMTDTKVTSRVLGSAWPQHFNKPVAEALSANIEKVGMPTWDEKDVTLAKALQKELGVAQAGLETKVRTLQADVPLSENYGGGSDDVGDISWNVPTVTLRYPANIPNLPGHHWANAIAMATPIAHKGTIAGAKAQAMTILDLLLKPELVQQAKQYFTEQTRNQKYEPLIGADDQPATFLNRDVLEQYRPAMRKYYFDPARYKTYLEQLGIKYPTVR
jgi:aminobenzoyl-glutamate utilization protein B